MIALETGAFRRKYCQGREDMPRGVCTRSNLLTTSLPSRFSGGSTRDVNGMSSPNQEYEHERALGVDT